MRGWSSSRGRRGAAVLVAALVATTPMPLVRLAVPASAGAATCAPLAAGAAGSVPDVCDAAASFDEQGACTLAVVGGPFAVLHAKPDPDHVELDGSLKITPTAIELIEPLGPGDVKVAGSGDANVVCTLTLRSRAPVKTTYRLTPVGIAGADARGRSVDFIEVDDEDAASTAISWLEPAAKAVDIEPRGVVDVPIRIRVPTDAASGGHYAGIAISTEPAKTQGANAVGIETRIVIPFLMEVAGGSRTELELRDASAPLVVWNREDWRYSARIKNSGNVHATPQGRIRIRSIFGGTVATLPIEGRVLLPGGAAPTKLTWKGAPWFGIYRVDARLTPKGEGAPVVRDHRWLVALPPWWLLLIVLLVLLLVVGGSWARRRYERRWAEQHHVDLDEDEDAHIELGPV